jgi:hypothetical protein
MATLRTDTVGWLIGNLHQLLGHDKAAAVLGVPVGDKAACLLCRYEREPTEVNRQAAERALGGRPA